MVDTKVKPHSIQKDGLVEVVAWKNQTKTGHIYYNIVITISRYIEGKYLKTQLKFPLFHLERLTGLMNNLRQDLTAEINSLPPKPNAQIKKGGKS